VKVKGSMAPPSKRPVSAASIFKQPPKRVKKTVATPILHASTMKKPTHAKPGLSSSPGKTGKRGGRKQDDLHPLAAAFNGKR
jgi:hypothetical protein